MSQRIKKARRRHLIELFSVMAVYVAAVFVASSLAKILDKGPLLAIAALVPALAIAGACFVSYRFYQRMDERQQRIQANAAAVTLIVAIVAASALGFLKTYGVFAYEDDFIWFTPFLIITWGLARRFMGDDC